MCGFWGSLVVCVCSLLLRWLCLVGFRFGVVLGSFWLFFLLLLMWVGLISICCVFCRILVLIFFLIFCFICWRNCCLWWSWLSVFCGGGIWVFGDFMILCIGCCCEILVCVSLSCCLVLVEMFCFWLGCLSICFIGWWCCCLWRMMFCLM